MEKLYLVWYEKEKLLNIIGLLSYDKKIYRFQYLNYLTSDLQLFSKNGLYQGFMDINGIYYSKELFPTIKNRLPNKKRTDYKKICDYFKINSIDDDFTVLKKTEGKTSNDNFIFITEKKLKEILSIIHKKSGILDR